MVNTVLSSVIGDDTEFSVVSVTTLLDVTGATKVVVASVVTAVVLVTGGTDVELFDGACLFANSIKLVATSGSC